MLIAWEKTLRSQLQDEPYSDLRGEGGVWGPLHLTKKLNNSVIIIIKFYPDYLNLYGFQVKCNTFN